MSQQMKVGSHRTTISTIDGTTRVIYWSTCVVQFDANEITLYTGGHYTATTKTRMNQASNQFDLGFTIYQDNWEWYVDYQGETLPYSDGMTLTR